jgi:hemolysin activation/secretion protein
MDYKHFDQDVTVGLTTDKTPIYYYPLSLNYSATWVGKKSLTEFNAGITMGLRGMGSRGRNFERNRFGADGNFFYFRGDLSRTQQLPWGLALFGKVQGQAAGAPLVNSEQFGGGGLNTVRGYLEAEALGDNAIFGTIELRSPSILTATRKVNEGESATEEPTGNELRFYAFGDAGTVTSHDTLPQQDSSFRLASIGIGSRLQLFDHVNGSVDFALPLTSLNDTRAHDPRVTFRVWADF